MSNRLRLAVAGAVSLCVVAAVATATAETPVTSHARSLDNNNGADWPGYGRTYGEGHYSPLAEVDAQNVQRLGLQWAMDLGPEPTTSQPVAVDGVLYFVTGFSIVHAVDAKSGQLLWRYDPKAAEVSGKNLRGGWGSRGLAWWNGKIYIATHDGRLIALDAKTGEPRWSTLTLDRDEPLYISAAPRIYNGKVVIGNASDMGKVRGYVSTYDAETGQQLWRFWTVPGNPADGFENKAMEMAAKTWHGEWWKYGGGGTVWNSIAYDPDSDTMFVGTGNAYPWNQKIRSEGKGDNLFLSSIVALNATTGDYKWHYQTNPGETWDYNATMDVQLGELPIKGKTRKVVMIAPKNGFFYVIDRETGKLISAEPFAKVTWAKRIDKKTGRPVENPESRFPNGTTATVWPSSAGAHSWMPMAFDPQRKLVFIPVVEQGMEIDDKGIDLKNWQAPTDRRMSFGVNINLDIKDPLQGTGALVAWDPVAQKPRWRVPQPTHANGGLLATAGGLVFQGTVAGKFDAYDAMSGQKIWSFDAQSPVLAPPISYQVAGRQYVSVLVGMGTTLGIAGPRLAKYDINPRTQARRMLTFALDGTAKLPPRVQSAEVLLPPADPDYRPDAALAKTGEGVFGARCGVCHGGAAVSGTHAPDLRRSAIPTSAEAFASVVRDGALEANGMPKFDEISDQELAAMRQYLRSRADDLRQGRP